MTRSSNVRFAGCNHLGKGAFCHRCAAATKLIADADRGCLDESVLIRLRTQFSEAMARVKDESLPKEAREFASRKAESARSRIYHGNFSDAEKAAMRNEAARLKGPQGGYAPVPTMASSAA